LQCNDLRRGLSQETHQQRRYLHVVNMLDLCRSLLSADQVSRRND